MVEINEITNRHRAEKIHEIRSWFFEIKSVSLINRSLDQSRKKTTQIANTKIVKRNITTDSIHIS